jgi:low temperature requirement protein LtrA
MWVGSSNPDQGQAVRSFAALSVGGLGSALLGGYLGGEAQVYLWSMTIFLDLVAAMVAADSEQWHLHPEHFAERHGLIVIIALGESLIVAAGALVASFGGEVLLVAILAVLITCGLWWTYFPLAKPELEHALEAADERTRSNLARDAFSIAHFPMLCGVIAYAVGLEDALTHPTVPLPGGPRLAIALGLFLFVGGTAIAQWRATCGSPLRRVVICGLTSAAIYLVVSVPPLGTLGIALAGVGAIGFGDELKAQRLRAS